MGSILFYSGDVEDDIEDSSGGDFMGLSPSRQIQNSSNNVIRAKMQHPQFNVYKIRVWYQYTIKYALQYVKYVPFQGNVFEWSTRGTNLNDCLQP
jgi:hypothetical protein